MEARLKPERDYGRQRESTDKNHNKRRTNSDEMKRHKSPKGKYHGKDDQPRKSSSERSRHRSSRTRSKSRNRHSDRSPSKTHVKDRNRHKSSEDRRSRHGSSSLAERVAEAAENERRRRDRIGVRGKGERDWDRGKRRLMEKSEEIRETSKEDELGTILKGQNPIGWVNLNAQKWNCYPQFEDMGAFKPGRFGQGQIFKCSLRVDDYVTNGTGRSKKEAKQECYKAMVLLMAAPKKPKPTVPSVPSVSETETSGAKEIKQEQDVNPSHNENAPACSLAIPSLLSLPPIPAPAPPERPKPWFYSQEILKATSGALFGHPISLLMERQMKMKLAPPEFQFEKQKSFNMYSWHGFKPDFIFSCTILLNRGDPRVYFGRGATKKEGKFQAALAVFADTIGIADQMKPASPTVTSGHSSSVAASNASSSTLGSTSTSSLPTSSVVCSTSSSPNSSATISSIVNNNDPLYPKVIEMASNQRVVQATHPVEETSGESSKAKSKVSNMKVPELRQELAKRNLVSKGTRAMLSARLDEALWQEEVAQLRSTLEQKGLSTKGTKEELASRLEVALMSELTEALRMRNLSTEGTKVELSRRLEEALENEKCEVKVDTDAEDEKTKAALNKIGSSMELTDEEKSLISKLRKCRKSSDSILKDLIHDLEKKAKKRKRDRSKSPKHGDKKKWRKTKDKNEGGSSAMEDHKIKRKTNKYKKDKKRKSSERSSKKREKGSKSESKCKYISLEDFVVVDAVGEVDEII